MDPLKAKLSQYEMPFIFNYNKMYMNYILIIHLHFADFVYLKNTANNRFKILLTTQSRPSTHVCAPLVSFSLHNLHQNHPKLAHWCREHIKYPPIFKLEHYIAPF